MEIQFPVFEAAQVWRSTFEIVAYFDGMRAVDVNMEANKREHLKE